MQIRRDRRRCRAGYATAGEICGRPPPPTQRGETFDPTTRTVPGTLACDAAACSRPPGSRRHPGAGGTFSAGSSQQCCESTQSRSRPGPRRSAGARGGSGVSAQDAKLGEEVAKNVDELLALPRKLEAAGSPAHAGATAKIFAYSKRCSPSCSSAAPIAEGRQPPVDDERRGGREVAAPVGGLRDRGSRPARARQGPAAAEQAERLAVAEQRSRTCLVLWRHDAGHRPLATGDGACRANRRANRRAAGSAGASHGRRSAIPLLTRAPCGFG
jgi:hypothetical protein